MSCTAELEKSAQQKEYAEHDSDDVPAAQTIIDRVKSVGHDDEQPDEDQRYSPRAHPRMVANLMELAPLRSASPTTRPFGPARGGGHSTPKLLTFSGEIRMKASPNPGPRSAPPVSMASARPRISSMRGVHGSVETRSSTTIAAHALAWTSRYFFVVAGSRGSRSARKSVQSSTRCSRC